MPTYDYACESCGKRFDVWQKMSDEPLTICPDCAGHVHRVIHATGVLFKGSGFYSTDHRGASTAATTSDAGSASETPAASSAESTPAASTPKAPSAPAATPATAPATTPATTKAAS